MAKVKGQSAVDKVKVNSLQISTRSVLACMTTNVEKSNHLCQWQTDGI